MPTTTTTGMKPAIRAVVQAEIEPLLKRIAELESKVAELERKASNSKS